METRQIDPTVRTGQENDTTVGAVTLGGVEESHAVADRCVDWTVRVRVRFKGDEADWGMLIPASRENPPSL